MPCGEALSEPVLTELGDALTFCKTAVSEKKMQTDAKNPDLNIKVIRIVPYLQIILPCKSLSVKTKSYKVRGQLTAKNSPLPKLVQISRIVNIDYIDTTIDMAKGKVSRMSTDKHRLLLPMASRLVNMTLLLALVALVALGVFIMYMPGKSLNQWVIPEDDNELLTERKQRLKGHVNFLAQSIGERSSSVPGSLDASLDYLESYLKENDLNYERKSFGPQNRYANLEVTLAGQSSSEKILVVGAHYDSAVGTPGANDNASGVALLLELARDLKDLKLEQEIRLVFFVNEEPPYFKTPLMGSKVYAENLRQESKEVSCMISLETLGYYSDQKGSQRYPAPLNLFYPSTGNFVAVVGNLRSASTIRKTVSIMRQQSIMPVQGGAFPEFLPGISWSDHWSFWQAGYCGLMLTDTAPFRFPFYHTSRDLPEAIDFMRLSLLSKILPVVVSTLTKST